MHLTIKIPEWLPRYVSACPRQFSSLEERMRFVIELSRENIIRETGGPFAAGIFTFEGHLISACVNLVEYNNSSLYHAEIMALVLAQKTLGTYDISQGNTRFFEMTASTEPCVMCFGALHWSGIQRLACGARDEDARRIGFDEGPKISGWAGVLEQKGMEVHRDILRTEAAGVLNMYKEQGGVIYNPGQPPQG